MRALATIRVALALLVALGAAPAAAQSLTVVQQGSEQHAVIDQQGAASSARLTMQGHDNRVQLLQAGDGHRAELRLLGSELGGPPVEAGDAVGHGAQRGAIVQRGSAQELALLLRGERIGFELAQEGIARNRIDARLEGSDLRLSARQSSPDTTATQQMRLQLDGSGHRVIAEQVGEAARGGGRADGGEGNLLTLVQSGHDLTATLRQQGDGNRIDARQTGAEHRLDAVQRGDGNHAEVVQQGGVPQSLGIEQRGGATVTITQGGR